jgi:hypothetical protein
MRIPDELFAQLLPRAAGWAEKQEQYILMHPNSLPLTEQGERLAVRAGVQQPKRVRLLAVPEMPLPEEMDLREAANALDLITPSTAGLTIGYGIFVEPNWDSSLLAHELVHVAQYEQCGSIRNFLQRYIGECNEYGYPDAPMEQAAIAFASSEYPPKS